MIKLYAAHSSAPYFILLSACVLALSTSAATDDERSFARVVSSADRVTVGFESQENGPRREVELAASAASDEEPLTEPDDEPLPSDGGQVRSLAQIRSTSSETPPGDPVARYLGSVYQRSTAKHDSDGDFTWKDAAAAARMELSMSDYVIGGMDPDFREQLFDLGQAMDAAGIDWTILSAFRDDYRQSLAVGFKAHVGNSFHGGSAATGGYGHGCAVDIAGVDGVSNDLVWNWLDQHGGEFGLRRPLPRVDPAHVQPTAGWHERAAALRIGRIQRDLENGATAPAYRRGSVEGHVRFRSSAVKSLSNLARLSWNADNSASLVTVLWPSFFVWRSTAAAARRSRGRNRRSVAHGQASQRRT